MKDISCIAYLTMVREYMYKLYDYMKYKCLFALNHINI
jgi:hypothetical protein